MNRLRTVTALVILGVAGVCDGIGYAILPDSYMRKIDS